MTALAGAREMGRLGPQVDRGPAGRRRGQQIFFVQAASPAPACPGPCPRLRALPAATASAFDRRQTWSCSRWGYWTYRNSLVFSSMWHKCASARWAICSDGKLAAALSAACSVKSCWLQADSFGEGPRPSAMRNANSICAVRRRRRPCAHASGELLGLLEHECVVEHRQRLQHHGRLLPVWAIGRHGGLIEHVEHRQVIIAPGQHIETATRGGRRRRESFLIDDHRAVGPRLQAAGADRPTSDRAARWPPGSRRARFRPRAAAAACATADSCPGRSHSTPAARARSSHPDWRMPGDRRPK